MKKKKKKKKEKEKKVRPLWFWNWFVRLFGIIGFGGAIAIGIRGWNILVSKFGIVQVALLLLFGYSI